MTHSCCRCGQEEPGLAGICQRILRGQSSLIVLCHYAPEERYGTVGRHERECEVAGASVIYSSSVKWEDQRPVMAPVSECPGNRSSWFFPVKSVCWLSELLADPEMLNLKECGDESTGKALFCLGQVFCKGTKSPESNYLSLLVT